MPTQRQRTQLWLEHLDNIVREVIGGQSLLVSLPSPVRGDDGKAATYPTVLDCGCGNGVFIERLLEEKDGDVDVSRGDDLLA